MNFNAYQFLGLTTSATREEVDQKYQELKAQYQRDRFLPGEEGNVAAENLERLELCYKDIIADLEGKQAQADFGSIYGQIADLIKKDELTKAQELLDACSSRDGEWHYLQSIVFYKHNWFLESKKQLEFALQLEPNNSKYIDSYDKLKKIIASKTVKPENIRTTDSASFAHESVPGNGTCTGNACCDCLLCNACCNCISCMH